MRIKNWSRFQHYKSGKNSSKPEWIKLYRNLLDDIEWHDLDGLDAKVLVMLWMLASENGGALPPLKTIAFRLRLPEKQILSVLQRLPHWVDDAPSGVLGQSYAETRLEEEENLKKNRRDTTYPLSPDGDETLSKAFDAYNETAKDLGLPLAKKLDDGRRKQLKARLKTYGLDGWMQALANLRQLPFCLGENDNGWRASFDFLIQAKSFPKVLEMQYGGKPMSRSKRATLKLLQEERNGVGGQELPDIGGRRALLEFSQSAARRGAISGPISGCNGGTHQSGDHCAAAPPDGICIEGTISDDRRRA